MHTKEDKMVVRMLVNAREDFQAMRKRMDNRIGRKANGKSQDIEERTLRADDLEYFQMVADEARKQEKSIEKKLKDVLKRFPIYTNWLIHIKGIGEIAAGRIIGEYNIEEASTVSKMWQFTGLNPGMVIGKKRVKPTDYKESMGKIIGSIGEDHVVLTDELVRGDKLTPSFISPFNKRLRTAMVGVLADGFIKAKAPYALEYYYPYKMRLSQEQNEINGEDKKWCDVSKGRRDRAAKRYMIKNFLKDLYAAWRNMEGLPIREPYAEEYLEKRHAA